MSRPTSALTNELAQVRDFGFGAAQTGTPFLWVDFEFVDLQDDKGEPIDIRHYFYLTDNTIEYAMRDVKTLGYEGNIFDLADQKPGIQGAQVRLTTAMEEYEGKTRAKVKFINAKDSTGGGGAVTPLDSDALKKLEAKLKPKMKVIEAKAKTVAPAKPAAKTEKAASQPSFAG